MARPTKYTEALAKRICDRLAGGESLRSICSDKGIPHWRTVCYWVVRNDAFFQQYVQAREAAGYAHADRIIDVVYLMESGKIDANTGKAMMDGLKWAAERMAPKKHSPRLLQEHTGPDGQAMPVAVNVQYVGGGHQS